MARIREQLKKSIALEQEKNTKIAQLVDEVVAILWNIDDLLFKNKEHSFSIVLNDWKTRLESCELVRKELQNAIEKRKLSESYLPQYREDDSRRLSERSSSGSGLLKSGEEQEEEIEEEKKE